MTQFETFGLVQPNETLEPKTLLGKKYDLLQTQFETLQKQTYLLKKENAKLKKDKFTNEVSQENKLQLSKIAETTASLMQIYDAFKGEKKVDNISKFEPSENLWKQIQDFAPTAERFLEDLVNGKFEGVSVAIRAKYASLALARAGYAPVQKIQAIHATLTREDIEKIKQRSQLALEDSTIEGEFQPFEESTHDAKID